jgi:hypothetical protein
VNQIAEKPLSDDKLAPPPSKEQILGLKRKQSSIRKKTKSENNIVVSKCDVPRQTSIIKRNEKFNLPDSITTDQIIIDEIEFNLNNKT